MYSTGGHIVMLAQSLLGQSLIDALREHLLILAAAGAVVLLFALWYLWAMGRLFSRIGLPIWQGWVPIVNEWQLIRRASLPGWVVLMYFVPGLGIVALVVRTIAQHRLGREAGVGAGYTVLGLLFAPLWATLIAGRFHRPVAAYPSSFAGGSATGVTPGYSSAAGTTAPWNPQAAPTNAPPMPPHVSPPAAVVSEPQMSPATPVARDVSAPLTPQVPPTPPAPHTVSAQAAPVSSVPSAPGVPAAPAAPGMLPQETEAEYERLAAESFLAPPAVPLHAPIAPEPFSWTAATQNPEPPAPVAPPPPVHPAATPMPPGFETASIAVEMGAGTPKPANAGASGITARYDPLPPIAVAPEAAPDDDLDRTIVVAKPSRVTWSLVLPDQTELVLQPDTIVGRRPGSGAAAAAGVSGATPATGESGGVHLLAVPDSSRTLSKVHARLRLNGDEWTIEDLGSTNGVFLFDADGSDREIAAHTEVLAGRHFMLGTLEVRIKRSDEN